MRRLSASGEQIRTPSEKAFRSYTISTLLMLIAPAVMAFYYYRWRVLLLLVVSISIAALCDAAGAALMRRKPGMDPLYAALTGAMIALLLPASAPLWLPAAGSAFAIVAAKLPFGSAEKTPFVPAAAGIAFLCVCWPELVFTYPAIDSSLPMAVTGSEGFVQGASFASMLKVHNSIDGNILSYFNAVIGKVPGPMGATCMLVMFGTAIAIFYFPFFPLAQFRGLCSGVLRMFCSLPADFDGAQAVPNDGDFSGHAGVYRAVSFAESRHASQNPFTAAALRHGGGWDLYAAAVFRRL